VSDDAKMSRSDDCTLPPELPGFDVFRQIGKGGFGRVWLATNRTTGLLCAVKTISRRRLAETDRATRELTSIIRLEANVRNQHPNLMPIRHVGETDEYLFYVMDLADDVSGSPATTDLDYQPSTLRSRLKDGYFVPEECLRYARQLTAGLACLHEKGMVHRDVKPANCVFVDGQLKLADFGLLTESHGTISCVGTRPYMPPDGRMDAQADVYAAGLIIYEMISGLPVDCFPSLANRAQDVGDDPILEMLNRLMLRACEHDRGRRFQNAGQMLAELADPKAKPSSRPSTRFPRRMIVPIVGILLLLASVLAFVLGRAVLRANGQGIVHVNFITKPYEATIYLDDTLWLQPNGEPYRTPCTVPNLQARTYHVVFRREGSEDFDSGQVDFTETREIVAHLSSQPHHDAPNPSAE